MKHLDLNSTIGDWLSKRPHAYQVFESLRLDCRGARGNPLQQACWERRLPPLDVLAQLHGDVETGQQNGEAVYDRSIGLMESVTGG